MGLGICLICFCISPNAVFFYPRGQPLSVRMGRVTGALQVHLSVIAGGGEESRLYSAMMFGVHFLCLWAVKGHQVSFHTPFLNHTIVFWDKIKGRTLALPGICWSPRTAVYLKCPPPPLFCSVISLILFTWCFYLGLPAKDGMAKLPHLLDCGVQILLC